MTRKSWMLIAFAVLLGGASFYLNRDWFGGRDIQIFHRSLPARALAVRGRHPDTGAIEPLLFGFNRPLRLKSLEVMAVSDLATNRYPHILWHLVSESNSLPIQDFIYGSRINGMHPEIKGASPDPLAPGVPYRLFVKTGSSKLEHDFTPEASKP